MEPVNQPTLRKNQKTEEFQSCFNEEESEKAFRSDSASTL